MTLNQTIFKLFGLRRELQNGVDGWGLRKVFFFWGGFKKNNLPLGLLGRPVYCKMC